MTTVHGLIRVLAGSAGVDVGRLTGLSDLFDRLVGAATFLMGLAMALIGITLLIAPEVSSSIIHSLGALVVGHDDASTGPAGSRQYWEQHADGA